MSRFIDRGALAPATDQDDGKWVVVQPVVYQSDVAGRTITVPFGFVTDLASVPRLPLVYDLCGSTASEAAIVHDYLYSTHLVDRATADAVLREASAVTGVPAWRRWLMWAGVRVGGASHWDPAPASVEPTA